MKIKFEGIYLSLRILEKYDFGYVWGIYTFTQIRIRDHKFIDKHMSDINTGLQIDCIHTNILKYHNKVFKRFLKTQL